MKASQFALIAVLFTTLLPQFLIAKTLEVTIDPFKESALELLIKGDTKHGDKVKGIGGETYFIYKRSTRVGYIAMEPPPGKEPGFHGVFYTYFSASDRNDKYKFLKIKEIYRHGTKEGPYVEYRYNGNLQKKGTLVNGRWEGEVTFYDEEGNLQETQMFRAGERTNQ